MRIPRHLTSLIRTTHNSLCGLLFAWNCPSCKLLLPYPRVICDHCASVLLRIQRPFCERCGTPFPSDWRVKLCAECELRPRSPVTRIRSAFLYEGVVAQMIRALKYDRRGRFADFFSGKLLELALSEIPHKIQAIIPAPLHRNREWHRRFNQAELLGKGLASLLDVPVLKNLIKVTQTLPQSSLSGSARRKNLAGAFEHRTRVRCPKSVLLIDDVVTTGATLEECARVLRAAGARRVFALTVARAVLK